MRTQIETPRLLLIAATARMLEADIAGIAPLAAALGVEAPADWPPDLYDERAARYSLGFLERHPPNWGAHYFVRKDGGAPILIGVGGFKGAPEQGKVEIGYAIVTSAQRRGYATEAARGMAAQAFADAGVEVVLAHTLPELAASIGVLDKCGFKLAASGLEEGAVRYELQRRDWMAAQ